jgi:molybdopterin converting factor small subunit
MQITVQFFAQLRDLAGTSECTITLADAATLADLLAQLYQEYPALEKWDDRILIGAGDDFVRPDYRLRPGESIAIMPPVQGG